MPLCLATDVLEAPKDEATAVMQRLQGDTEFYMLL